MKHQTRATGRRRNVHQPHPVAIDRVWDETVDGYTVVVESAHELRFDHHDVAAHGWGHYGDLDVDMYDWSGRDE